GLWSAGNADDVRDVLGMRGAKRIDPVARAVALCRAAIAQPIIGLDEAEIDEARERYSVALGAGPSVAIPDPWRAGLGPNFFANYHARPDRELHAAAARYFLAATPALAESLLPARRARGSRVRIGLVSNFFCAHTVGWLTRGLIEG